MTTEPEENEAPLIDIEERLAQFRKDLSTNQREALDGLRRDVEKALHRQLSDLAKRIADIKDIIPISQPPDPKNDALLDQLFQLDRRLSSIEVSLERYQSEDRYARTRADIVRVLNQESDLSGPDPTARRAASIS